ncbi:hypothetical protein H4R18_002889 [Coemansia javaensis]|uniref:Uncharacterized protein n=1 Tax=Coemansia javaensis TaxID=2761396 RepID=A0A9W8H8H9_9FUNG|nr:hypothetical protein H4R18_002889 [Coemansia javaensis]
MGTRSLGGNVHARLFAKHIVQAAPHGGPGGEAALALGAAASLVFSRVRATGTVVRACPAGAGPDELRVVYIDDGTGVVPIALAAHAASGETDDASRERDAAVREEMEQRLALAAAEGTTVEVLGRICYAREGSAMPPVWIACSHIAIKDDPMSETVAVLDTLEKFSFYGSTGDPDTQQELD